MNGSEVARHAMVTEQLARRGITDPRVLEAFLAVPRELFVPDHLRDEAYEDHPVEIGFGQTTSQPYIIAFMLEALEMHGPERVLEIGAGSGYQTALLSRLAARVHSLERIPELTGEARARLARLGVRNADLYIGDGTRGWPDAAPFDRIVVGAGAPHVPSALVDQLAPDGVLILPVGEERPQRLKRIRRRTSGVDEMDLGPCIFVPLVGADGWPEP